MRAISLWQPWASAVARDAKRIETRHWSTSYRGPIAIHAAQRRVIGELIHYSCYWNWQGVFYDLLHEKHDLKLWKVLPFGAIVAVANLTDCRPTESFTIGELDTPRRPEGESTDLFNWTERQMGDYEIGRFGWVLSDIRPLSVPVPFSGNRKFFSVPDDLIRGFLKNS